MLVSKHVLYNFLLCYRFFFFFSLRWCERTNNITYTSLIQWFSSEFSITVAKRNITHFKKLLELLRPICLPLPWYIKVWFFSINCFKKILLYHYLHSWGPSCFIMLDSCIFSVFPVCLWTSMCIMINEAYKYLDFTLYHVS